MRINFVWQGFSGRYGQWRDGLWRAMKRIEEKHDVQYKEPCDNLEDCDVLLYWEAPMTILGENKEYYMKVQNASKRKALLFAGGVINKDWLDGFDHVFVESEINADELNALGVSQSTAFGINEDVFKPMNFPKAYDGFMQATFAGWKRQPLFSLALGREGLLCGRYQENDKEPWEQSFRSMRLPEMPYETVAKLINSSHCVVNTSEYWGGGQRCTLEAMACGVPVIVMSDSPKNMEYVEESGGGIVCEPNPVAIRESVSIAKNDNSMGEKGVKYVSEKWTSKHYANNLLKWIEQ